MAIEMIIGGGGDPFSDREVWFVGRQMGQAKCVAVDHPCHACSSAAVRSRFGDRMEARDGVRNAVHQGQIELVALRQAIQERVLVETHHFDHPIGRRAAAVKGQPAIGLSSDGMTAT